MNSPIGSKNNVKIFILYLLKNINYPIDFVTLNDIVMQTDYVMYLDFTECFTEMLEGELVEEIGATDDAPGMFIITEKGRYVAEQLQSDILSSILDSSLACALRYLDFKRRGINLSSSEEKLDDGKYKLEFKMTEDKETVFSLYLTVDSEDRAKRMRSNFNDRPEVIYRGVLALLSGNVNYLFDD